MPRQLPDSDHHRPPSLRRSNPLDGDRGEFSGATGRNLAVLVRHGDAAWRVEGLEAADCDWLQEVLTPAFTLGDNAPASGAIQPQIQVRIDASAHAALLAAAPASDTEQVSCFGLDGHVTDIRRIGDGLFHDVELGCLYRVQGSGLALELIASARRPALRIALLRVLRELAVAELPSRGALQLHAASIGTAGAALAICGPRRAGKTSLLLHLLGGGAVDYIANDRVIVAPLRARGWRVSGMPTTVSVRAGSVALFPHLRLAGLAHWRARMTLAEIAALPPPVSSATAADLSLSPAQFCRHLGLRARAQAPLAALLFPRIDPSTHGLRLRALDRRDCLRRIDTALLPPRPSVLTGESAAASTAQAQATEALCREVPGYDCILGTDVYADADGRAALLALVGGGVASARLSAC